MSYCKEVQRDIGAYVDNLLSEDTRQAMEQHICSCTACRKALTEFERVRGLVKGLDEVEPPPGFSFRIMTHIREHEAARKSLLDRLFRPFSVKIPIQTIATILIVVLGLYIYRATEPERTTQPLPAVEAEHSIETVRPQGGEILRGTEPSTAHPEGSQWKDRREPPEAKAVDRPAKELEKKADQAPPEGRGGPHRQPDTRFRLEEGVSPPIEKPAQGATAREERPVVTQPINQAPRTKVKAAPSGADTLLAGKGMSPPDLSVRVVDLARATQDVQRIVEGAAGRILRRESADNKEIFVIETGQDRIDELLSGLSALGNRKAWKPSVPTGRKSVVVTLELLTEP